MSDTEPTPAYGVKEANPGCAHCGAGKTYDVIGPGGVAESITWDDIEDAEAFADALNDAYRQGQETAPPINNGNTFVFCDHVVQLAPDDHRGCVRGAGHNGPHVYQNRRNNDAPSGPLVLLAEA